MGREEYYQPLTQDNVVLVGDVMGIERAMAVKLVCSLLWLSM